MFLEFLNGLILSGVPQGSVLGLLPISASKNDLCGAINYSGYQRVADDIEIHPAIKSLIDCNLP
jgi:hypothetical protein